MTTNDRVAVVTGGSRGIGREIGRQLASRGYTVVLTARDPAQGREVARAIDGSGQRVVSVPLDVADGESVATAFEAVLADHGRIDVLVNNAGIAIDGPDHKASSPDVDRVRQTLETNLYGSWLCCAAVVPAMRDQRYGRIVNLSSTMASLERTRDAESPAYRMSKVALNMLTRLLAAELEGSGVLVNAASPGYTRTDMSPKATRSVEDGADTPVWLATLPPDGPTGGFFLDRQRLEW